ncbi:hypothetical protein [Mesorhizobium abyssinicae]|uniref:hypothetical protein n=1 Tax=Mesorhizobium abyssinicae TaxID=1209958 RepID=UPI00348FBA65
MGEHGPKLPWKLSRQSVKQDSDIVPLCATIHRAPVASVAFICRLNGRVADVWPKRPIKAHLPARLRREASPGMTLARDDLSKSDAVLIATIENNVPELIIARTLIDE